MKLKENDYIVSSIMNPDFSPAEFKNLAGLTLKNTLMLSKDLYLLSKFIRENPLFLDDSGVFSLAKFDEFYDKKFNEFLDFANIGMLDDYAYSPFDTRRKATDFVRPFGMSLTLVPNPTRTSMGIVGPNKMGKPLLSDRELAQKERIFDFKTGNYRDYSPNDKSFTTNPIGWIASIFDEPLVLATYDSDGTHFDNILGKEVQHHKGLKKLNVNGLPYYETLAGRSLIGKDVLSSFDTLTIDGQGINKYDFFDSDGIDKSVAGTVAKTVTTFLPLIPFGSYYAGILVARELLKATPMLYGIGSALFTDNTELPMLNKLAAYGNKFSTSTSDYAKEHIFSFENFGNLVADVALQWGLQKAVVEGFQKLSGSTKGVMEGVEARALNEYQKRAQLLITDARLKGIKLDRLVDLVGSDNYKGLLTLVENGKWKETSFGRAAIEKFMVPAEEKIAKYTRMGLDMSLGYMAIISNTDVYNSAILHGATKEEAALMALGSTVGMFSVDKYLGLGEMFFNEASPRVMYRKSLTARAEEIVDNLKGGREVLSPTKDLKGLGKYFMAGIELGKNAIKKFNTKTKERTLGFFGKAFGEGLEEVSEELVTDMTKTLFQVAGQYGYASQKDYGAWKDAGDRYLMSFLGGTIGGGLFYLKDPGIQLKQAALALELLVRLKKAGEVRRELDKMHEKGLLGSTELSYVIEEGENPKFISADEKHISLNDFVYNMLNQSIDQLEEIIQRNRLDKTDDELFENLVLSDERFMRLNMSMALNDFSYVTGYQQRYQLLVERIVDIENMIKEEKDKGDSKADKDRINKLQESLNNALLERDKFNSGEYSLDYTLKMLFAMNPALYAGFAPVTVELFARAKGYDYSLLSGTVKEKIDKQFEEYKSNPKMKDNLDIAFDVFLNLLYKLTVPNEAGLPGLLGRINLENYKEWENIRELLDLNDPAIVMWNYDTKLDYESDEDYEYRAKRMPGESDEEFSLRIQNRKQDIMQHNELWKTWIQEVLNNTGTYMDANTKRRFQLMFKSTSEQRKKEILSKLAIDPLILELLSSIPDDTQLRALVRQAITEKINNKYNALAGSYVEDLGLGGSENILEDVDWFFNDILLPALGLADTKEINLGAIYDYVNNTAELKGKSLLDIVIDAYNSMSDEEGQVSPITIIPEFDIFKAYNEYAEQRKGIESNEELDESQKLELLREALKSVEFTDWRLDALLELKAKEIESILGGEAGLDKQIDTVLHELHSDEDLKILKLLDERLEKDTTATEILKNVASALGKEAVDILSGLESIHSIWASQERGDEFELSTDQHKYLEDAANIIQMAKAIVAATYLKSSLGENYNYAYNESINEFVHDHKGINADSFKNFKDLFTIEESLGASIMHALENYEKEIALWIELSDSNHDNKVLALLTTILKLHQVRAQILKDTFAPVMDIPYLDDLSEGFDAVTDLELAESNFILEKKFHENIQKLIKKGVSEDDIIDTIILAIGNDDNLLSGKTSKIDQNLSVSNFTDYDKYMYMVALMYLNPEDYLKKELAFINNNQDIAPIPTQLPGMFLGASLDVNPAALNKALDKLAEIAKKKGLNIPVLYNTRIYTGLGGAGKTLAEARFVYNPDEKTWISGPTLDLIDGLKVIAPEAEEMPIDELIDTILGSNVDVLKGAKRVSKGGIDGRYTFVLGDIAKSFNKKDAPKHIIIDEATHIDSVRLQAISLYAKEVGAKLTLLGDENQEGYDDSNGLGNLQREVVIAYRTPRLNVTLRTGNVWKTLNLKKITALMDKLRDATAANDAQTKYEVLEELKKLKLSFYENENTLNGDKIIPLLTLEDVDRLVAAVANMKASGKTPKIAFIGDVNSANYKLLKNSLEVVKLINPLNVQGLEFDFTIVDKLWATLTLEQYNGGSGYLLDYLQDIYTMISRSREGSLLIDRGTLSHSLFTGDGITNSKENYTTESVNLTKDNIKRFSESRKKYIEYILETYGSKIKEEEKEEEELEEKKAEEGSEKEEEEETEESLYDEAPGEVIDIVSIDAINQEINNPENKPEFKREETQYRAYSNIQFRGNVIENKRGDWTVDGTLRRDLGMFGEPGDIIATTAELKRTLTRSLNAVKALFTFSQDIDAIYSLLPENVRLLITREELKKVEYYAVAEDYDEYELHALNGLTFAEKDKVSFMRGPKNKKQVISIQVRIPTAVPIVITLGAVANPESWVRYIENPKNGFSEEEKERERLKVEKYKLDLKKIVKDREIKIKKPTFSNQTELYEIPTTPGQRVGLVRLEIRLGSLDIDDPGALSEWDFRTSSHTISPVYIVTNNLQNLNTQLSNKLKGKPVIFVSSNPNLDPNSLASLWQELQKNRGTDKDNGAQVRMLVLHNAGVSFNSLYRGTFLEIYRRSTLSDNEYALPPRLRHTAIRMFAAMWNFRANIKKFHLELDKFLEANSWDRNKLNIVALADSEYYDLAKSDLKVTYVTDDAFKSWLDNHKELPNADDVKKLREFNDSLAEKVREFRVGYSARSGGYIRLLTNIKKDNPFYDETLVYGVYLNPDLLYQYDELIDNIFKKVVNVFFPDTSGLDILSQVNYKIVKKWANLLDSKGSVTLGTESGNIEVKFGKQLLVEAFPLAIMHIAHHLYRRAELGESAFMSRYSDKNEPAYHINVDINGVNTEIDYLNIDKAFEFLGIRGLFKNDSPEILNLPGYIDFEYSKTDDNGYIDSRLENFFNILFHGIIALKQYNDFNYSTNVAADAIFKKGFFSDPIIISHSGDENFALTSVNPALLLVDKIPGGPVFEWDLTQETAQEEELLEEGAVHMEHPLLPVLLKLGLDPESYQLNSPTVDGIKKDIDELEVEVNSRKKSVFTSGTNSIDLNNLIDNISYQDGKVTITYFTDIHPELKGTIENVSREGFNLQVQVNGKKFILKLDGNLISVDPIIETDVKVKSSEKSTKVTTTPIDVIKSFQEALDTYYLDDENYGDQYDYLVESILNGEIKEWADRTGLNLKYIVGSLQYIDMLNGVVKIIEDEDAKVVLDTIVQSILGSCPVVKP